MKTIEITTAQKVTIQYELASIGNRFLAYFIDCLIVGGIIIFLTILSVRAMERQNYDYFLYVVIFPIAIFYHIISEILLDGQSIGKRSVGIKVVKLNGDAPSAHDYFIRWVFRFVDLIISIGSVAALMVSASPQSQRIGDVLAGTTVIRQTSSRLFSLRDILKIATLENYTITYPDVTKLSETDMLFIKKALERERQYSNPAHQQVIKQLSDRVAHLLNIAIPPKDKRLFLRTLLNDYIVLTR